MPVKRTSWALRCSSAMMALKLRTEGEEEVGEGKVLGRGGDTGPIGALEEETAGLRLKDEGGLGVSVEEGEGE